VNLAPAGVAVPDLFGTPLQGALNALSTRSLDVDVIIDALGKEVSRTQVPAEYQNAPVLMQLPDAGTVIDPATTRLRLVVAAAVREEPIVTLPSLVGLTQAEAARALDAVGLRLGKVTFR
jgi:beta-lactam-binding protein with PASTA domain